MGGHDPLLALCRQQPPAMLAASRRPASAMLAALVLASLAASSLTQAAGASAGTFTSAAGASVGSNDQQPLIRGQGDVRSTGIHSAATRRPERKLMDTTEPRSRGFVTLDKKELSEKIVGSCLGIKKPSAAFRERWACLTSTNTSHWRLDPTPRILPWPETPFGPCRKKEGYLGLQSNAKVASGEYTESNWPVSDSLKLVWEPRPDADCTVGNKGRRLPTFASFNGIEFCASMKERGGSVFIVGDEFSEHFYLAFMLQLSASKITWRKVAPTAACAAFLQANPGKKCERFMACVDSEEDVEELVYVNYVQSDFLGKVHDYSESAEQRALFDKLKVPEFEWGVEMVREEASVVILSRGAHWVSTQEFTPQLNYTIRQVRTLLPDSLLVYRSASAGHPNCQNFKGPLDAPPDLKWAPNGWEWFDTQNEIARGIVEDVGGFFLDTAAMASLRPEWHLSGMDCLHMCLPGPITDWVTMFVKALTEITNGVGTSNEKGPPGLPPSSVNGTVAKKPPAGGATGGGEVKSTEAKSAAGGGEVKGTGEGAGGGGKWESTGGARGAGGWKNEESPKAGAGGEGGRAGGWKSVADDEPPVEVEGIPGSKIRTPEEAKAFRERWKCLTSLESNQWKLNPTPRLLPWPEKVERACAEKPGYLGAESNRLVTEGVFNETYWPVSESLKYVWQPREGVTCGAEPAPSLVAFDAEEFCSTMRRRGGTLFILGDSFGAFTWASIKATLAMNGKQCVDQPPSEECNALWWKQGKRCQVCMACGESLAEGGVRVYFLTSNYLGKVHHFEERQNKLFRRLDAAELPWGEEAVRENASVVVVNRGTFFVPNEPFKAQLKYSFNELRKLLPNTLLIYRATAPGHPDCNKYKAPVDTPPDLSQAPENWGKYAEQNAVAKELVEKAGGVFLDIEPLMSLRPEWHMGGHDCLHWCMPGPIDDWAKLLSKMLKELV